MKLRAIERPSLARDFYAKITGDHGPVEALQRLVGANPPVFETEWLDFKGAARLGDNDIKKTWSEALAGFANTQGGVLIWGVDARKDPATGIDAASGLSPVRDPAALKSRLNELHAQATDPPVLGVEIEAYSIDGKSGEGFVVCLIPESPFRPHRAEHAQRQYLIRAGDDFVAASVSLLRNLFYPQSRCLLVPKFRAASATKDGHKTYEFHGFLKNVGSATAFDTSAIVDCKPRPSITYSLDSWHTGSMPRPDQTSTNMPIHPGVSAHFFSVSYRDLTSAPEVTFTIQIFARDAEPFEWTISFTGSEVLGGTTKKGGVRRTLSF